MAEAFVRGGADSGEVLLMAASSRYQIWDPRTSWLAPFSASLVWQPWHAVAVVLEAFRLLLAVPDRVEALLL